MRGLFSTIIVVLVALMIVTTEAGKNKKEKNKGGKGGSDCAEWRYGSCVANNGDCGAGTREGTCNEQTKKVKCRVPCNWKKNFGADCKYKFSNWGECDAATSTKSRTGTLVKALFSVDCQQTISVSKPCTTKVKNKPKGKKGKGKGN
ncbi:midkine a [Sinocyclocheilus rhinocerous]|uniref:Midkine n=1 Tax=Sinocyclocheilus rhinocerous TaxID=307959 RepID=A0A673IG18_9TELE|nr:PREDICTED: midkine [Sinocyclocheilus rhinocerous]